MAALLRPYRDGWEVLRLDPKYGRFVPVDSDKDRKALESRHPDAVFEHPRPILPPDLGAIVTS